MAGYLVTFTEDHQLLERYIDMTTEGTLPEEEYFPISYTQHFTSYKRHMIKMYKDVWIYKNNKATGPLTKAFPQWSDGAGRRKGMF